MSRDDEASYWKNAGWHGTASAQQAAEQGHYSSFRAGQINRDTASGTNYSGMFAQNWSQPYSDSSDRTNVEGAGGALVLIVVSIIGLVLWTKYIEPHKHYKNNPAYPVNPTAAQIQYIEKLEESRYVGESYTLADVEGSLVNGRKVDIPKNSAVWVVIQETVNFGGSRTTILDICMGKNSLVSIRLPLDVETVSHSSDTVHAISRSYNHRDCSPGRH